MRAFFKVLGVAVAVAAVAGFIWRRRTKDLWP